MLWSYILTLVGITGFYLAGKKVWWCWYINIANQVLWLTYALITGQWGFIIGTVFYTVVFVQNAYKWTVEHRVSKELYDGIYRDDLAEMQHREQLYEKALDALRKYSGHSEPKIDPREPIGRIKDVSVDANGNLAVTGEIDDIRASHIFDRGATTHISFGIAMSEDQDGIWVSLSDSQ